MLILLTVWATLATLWAIVFTVLFVNNPLPFPDRGHRVFGVKDDRTRAIVVRILESVSGRRSRFTFDSGSVHQTILSDGFTSIHYIDDKSDDLPANAISFAVGDPLRSAVDAVSLLRSEGFDADIVDGIETGLPPNHLVPVRSNAFDGWVLVLRRPILKMPRPEFRK